MHNEPSFDLAAAHRYFSAYCFNQAWELMDNPARTPDEDESMLALTLASLWHWSQRPDCTPTNRSIGYWQTSRIYSLLKQPDNARHYAQLSLTYAQAEPNAEDVSPFYLGYAYEALARAEVLAGSRDLAEAHLAQARQCATRIFDESDRDQLLEDLERI